MAVHGDAGRRKSCFTPCQHRTDHTGQHVPRTRRGEFGVAAGVDAGGLTGCGDDAARAFEDDGAGKAVGQLLGGQQAVGLDVGGTAGQ